MYVKTVQSQLKKIKLDIELSAPIVHQEFYSRQDL